jgi:hypothetical protein
MCAIFIYLFFNEDYWFIHNRYFQNRQDPDLLASGLGWGKIGGGVLDFPACMIGQICVGFVQTELTTIEKAGPLR